VPPDDRNAAVVLTPDSRPRVLAEGAGFEIVAVGDRVWFFHRRTWGPTIAASVSGGVAAIATINVVLLTTSRLAGGGLDAPWAAIAIVLLVAVLGGSICWFSLKLRRRRLERPHAELRPLAIVDRTTGMLLDGDGLTIAPVTHVRAGRAMMISSTAPSVALRPPRGPRIEVCRGTLIGGGIDGVLRVLAELGFAR
jgi:hypothetical protein